MVQPLVYNTEQELIDWLKYDLQEQVERGVEENDLVLNIGFKKGNKKEHKDKIELNFKFYFITFMKKIEYNKQDDYGNSICPYQVNCNDVIFKYSVDFSYFVFNNNLNFIRSVFEMDVVFLSSTFNKILSFKNSNFYKIADFSYSTLNFVVDFFDAVFNDRVCFDQTTFKGVVIFSKFTTKGTMEFRGSIFASEIIFLNITLNGMILFDNVIFDKDKCSVFFRSINYNEIKKEFNECYENSKIEIVNTVIDGRIDFRDVKINKINFKDSSVINGGVLNRINFEAEPENSDTARFLKHEELTRSDTIKALKYKAIEKDRYYDEIKKGIKIKFNNIFKKKDNKIYDKNADQNTSVLFADFISLFFSQFSNNHGQNWIQAVLFTFITGFQFFLIAYILIQNKNIPNYIYFVPPFLVLPFIIFYFNKKFFHLIVNYLLMLEALVLMIGFIFSIPSFMRDFFNYLIPVNFYLMKEVGTGMDNSSLIVSYLKIPNSDIYSLDIAISNTSKFIQSNQSRLFFFYISYFLGKIAIGYGIFQTIQAFRKFNIK